MTCPKLKSWDENSCFERIKEYGNVGLTIPSSWTGDVNRWKQCLRENDSDLKICGMNGANVNGELIFEFEENLKLGGFRYLIFFIFGPVLGKNKES